VNEVGPKLGSNLYAAKIFFTVLVGRSGLGKAAAQNSFWSLSAHPRIPRSMNSDYPYTLASCTQTDLSLAAHPMCTYNCHRRLMDRY